MTRYRNAAEVYVNGEHRNCLPGVSLISSGNITAGAYFSPVTRVPTDAISTVAPAARDLHRSVPSIHLQVLCAAARFSIPCPRRPGTTDTHED